MGKQERKARKAKRKLDRQDRKQKRKAFTKAVKTAEIDVDLDSQPEFVEVFNQFWPMAKKALEYAIAIKLTKEAADDAIQVVVDLGDRITTGEASEDEKSEFVEKLELAWLFINIALEIIQQISQKKKTDDVIDQIIDIGDWILGKDDE